MKNFVALLCLIFCLLSSANAQNDSRNISFGLEGGLDILNSRASLLASQYNIINESGYHLSSYVQLKHPERNFAFSLGISYQQMDLTALFPLAFGCNHDGNGGSNDIISGFEDRYSLDFIGIPFNYKYYFGRKSINYFANIGFTPLLLYKEVQSDWFTECGISQEFSSPFFDEMYEINPLIVQFKIGLGWNFPFKKGSKSHFYIHPEFAYFTNGIVSSVFEIGEDTFSERIDITISYVLKTGFIF